MKAVLLLLFLLEAVQLCDHPQPRILVQDLTGQDAHLCHCCWGSPVTSLASFLQEKEEVCLSLISLPGTCPLQGTAANSGITMQFVSTAPFKTQGSHACQFLDCSFRQAK